MSVGPIRRCKGSQRLPIQLGRGPFHACSACHRVECSYCGRYMALYPNGTLVVHLPKG